MAYGLYLNKAVIFFNKTFTKFMVNGSLFLQVSLSCEILVVTKVIHTSCYKYTGKMLRMT